MRAHLTLRARPGARRALGLAAAFAVAALLAPAPLAADPGAEDLRALIYYLDHNDQRSVQAEMRRLRAQFPGWSPPDNLDALRSLGGQATATVDEAPIWARIERGDYSGARELINQGRREVPGWTPNAEMLQILELNEGQAAFDAAVSRRDHDAAIAAARRTPALMRCEAINNAWQLAEMYELADQRGHALNTYRGVLGTCTRYQDAEPTLEKANEIASLEQLGELFEAARQAAPANADRLDALEQRLRAGRGGAAPAQTAQASSAQQGSGSGGNAQANAASGTAAAAPSAPTAPAASVGGGSLPLRGDGRVTRVRASKEAGDWAACLTGSSNPRSVELLYERAWCAYNMDRPGEALAGFSAAARAGSALGGNVPRDASFGVMLASLELGMTEEAARLAASTNLTSEQRVEVESIILDQRGVRAYLGGEYRQSIDYLDALERLAGSLRRDLAMLRGYAYMNTRQLEEAHEAFSRLHSELATDETRAAIESIRGMRMAGN
ncbi:MAG: hypothetical protein JJT95_14150 [Pararhodobacter sp.]|nr:hypothetical protein [Pararhodobacter sp.]